MKNKIKAYATLGTEFLPISQEEMRKLGWDWYDFLYIVGDAYVDHPSFGAALISRLLEAEGYRVCMLCQSKTVGGEIEIPFDAPRLGVLVSAGNIDSMVAHYTVAKRARTTDFYSPGGKPGARPDRAASVYAKAARKKFPDLPIILGGIEASLRRFAHYDYWENRVLPSLLSDCGADLISYGMGEHSITEIAKLLERNVPVSAIRSVRGTCYLTDVLPKTQFEYCECPSFESCCEPTPEGKRAYAEACRMQYREQDFHSNVAIVQRHGDRYLVQNPPALPLSQTEMDYVYSLPYCRTWHPSYAKQGGVPAIAEVRFSINHVRGCFGNCNFCSLAFHQGRFIQTRSHESVLAEARLLTTLPDFKGYLHDVGGPTANFRQPSCEKQSENGLCRERSCLATRCPNLKVSHEDYRKLLSELRALEGVKKVFIRSGIRFDYLMYDPDDGFFEDLVRFHISGQLKVAPEHCSDRVLKKMGKPSFDVFSAFKKKYEEINRKYGLKQYLVPYLMSSHPGSTVDDAIQLAEYLNRERIHPEQVQDYYPTPGTVSTCMYYTHLDPRTMQSVYVADTPQKKKIQRALLQWKNPKNDALIRKTLLAHGRKDLIGSSSRCLIPLRPPKPQQNHREK